MKARLLTITAMLSLLLFVANAVLLVRSFHVGDVVNRRWIREDGKSTGIIREGEWSNLWVYSSRGVLSWTYNQSGYSWFAGDMLPGGYDGAHWSHHTSNALGIDLAWSEQVLAFRLTRFSFARVDSSSPSYPDKTWGASLPTWSLLLVFSLLPIQRVISGGWRRRTKVIAGLCPACGYDLRATPGRCPECGRVIEN